MDYCYLRGGGRGGEGEKEGEDERGEDGSYLIRWYDPHIQTYLKFPLLQ